MGEREADELLTRAITRRFQPDDVIFRKDDPGNGLYGVVTGRVVVVSELLFLDRRHFMAFLARSPEATTRIIRLLCKRLRRTNNLVEDSIFLPVSLRLAKQLLALVDVYDLQATAQPTFPVGQAELGRMLGVSREIVARQLAIWRRAGLVEMQRGRITLRDRAALAALVSNA